ncbi:hypothetical protein [Neorhodopirellula pilleata]|uniref:Methyltransferase n=1 Tax=Neorhodopirellula pilleata TaxID=2714738 RepID=A0A5C6A985_9BACT|nr:hypothetical protein [Neorhodopirellula pilleata]TWT96544.1 hypothetical protein Pla100_30270 [Neorhodopirellula pilleata]
MPLHSIAVPDSIAKLPHTEDAERLIDRANERIEAFMLSEKTTIENFVPCDFHLLDQALTWIDQNHLMTGRRFCEIGSGFGVGALLASLRQWESVGIEIEPRLVEQSNELADELQNEAQFYCGSFIPRGIDDLADWATEVKNVDSEEGDVYDEIGWDMGDFDLFFAFPWPGEHGFFEAVFEACAADGALLLTYRGREGMDLVRKV